MAKRGDTVFIADIAGEKEASAELRETGLNVRSLNLDVQDVGAISSAIERIEEEAPLGTMVNNAGVAWIRPLVEVTPDDFDQLMAVNLRAVFFGTQAAARVMIPRRSGCSQHRFNVGLLRLYIADGAV